ncbi:hypothetical protein TIFTF001_003015 [Ficus carica]|uniref:Uncharacterized protein n=1 Tax=Ficus carica TaxID=3494 RepID=A0AA87ZB07_FICCA|nr:hypothetical protein TIFTF001_003015 [Ficus carica]
MWGKGGGQPKSGAWVAWGEVLGRSSPSGRGRSGEGFIVGGFRGPDLAWRGSSSGEWGPASRAGGACVVGQGGTWVSEGPRSPTWEALGRREGSLSDEGGLGSPEGSSSGGGHLSRGAPPRRPRPPRGGWAGPS